MTRPFTLLLTGIILCAFACSDSYAQADEGQAETEADSSVVVNNPYNVETEPEASTNRLSYRQGGAYLATTLSLMGYGYFSLRFNSARADSENARDAYVRDVSQNAERYANEGTDLSRIPAYLKWQEEFERSERLRESTAQAGVLAGVVVLLTVLDSATTGNRTTKAFSSSLGRVRVGKKRVGVALQF